MPEYFLRIPIVLHQLIDHLQSTDLRPPLSFTNPGSVSRRCPALESPAKTDANKRPEVQRPYPGVHDLVEDRHSSRALYKTIGFSPANRARSEDGRVRDAGARFGKRIRRPLPSIKRASSSEYLNRMLNEHHGHKWFRHRFKQPACQCRSSVFMKKRRRFSRSTSWEAMLLSGLKQTTS